MCSKQEKQSRSHKEMYQSSDKKGDNISQSHFLLLLNTTVGKPKARVKAGELQDKIVAFEYVHLKTDR